MWIFFLEGYHNHCVHVGEVGGIMPDLSTGITLPGFYCMFVYIGAIFLLCCSGYGLHIQNKIYGVYHMANINNIRLEGVMVVQLTV